MPDQQDVGDFTQFTPTLEELQLAWKHVTTL